MQEFLKERQLLPAAKQVTQEVLQEIQQSYDDVCCPGKECLCFFLFSMRFPDVDEAVDALREIKREAADLKAGRRLPPFKPRETPLSSTFLPLAAAKTPLASNVSSSLPKPRKPRTRSSTQQSDTLNLDDEDDGLETEEEDQEDQEPPTGGKNLVAYVPRKPLPTTTKARWDNGQAYSQEFIEFVKRNIDEMPFCVGMIQKLFGVSLNFLYHRNKDPDHLGGKFDKNPSKDIKTMDTVKKKLPKNLLSLDDLAALDCCKGDCPSKFSLQALAAHRGAYTKQGITNVSSPPLFSPAYL